MGISRTIQIQNGDTTVLFDYYKCEMCGVEIPESNGFVDLGDESYCCDCAFKFGIISEKEYLKLINIHLEKARAVIHDDVIYTNMDGAKFPWERDKRQQRHTTEYKQWRTSVFERDSYKCQRCGKVGGELNAHHIKPFAKYKELRYEVDNGITLCAECHRKVHRDVNL